MAEVVGLVFGVLPIVIEAVKDYRAVCKAFRDFRHYSREVKRIHKGFRVCERMFSNEYRLLLELVVDDDDVTHSMLEDFEHDSWKDMKLIDRLKKHLGESYETSKDLVDDIRETLKEVDKGLKSFNVLTSRQQKVTSVVTRP